MAEDKRTETGAPQAGDVASFACPVCTHRFTLEELQACHPACPMASGCAMVRCPSCGAEFPRPGPVTRWLERLLRGQRG